MLSTVLNVPQALPTVILLTVFDLGLLSTPMDQKAESLEAKGRCVPKDPQALIGRAEIQI